MQPKVNGLVYIGVKTDQFDAMCKFLGETLNLQQDHLEPDFATYLYA